MKLGSNRKAVGMGLDLREGPGSVSCYFVIVTIVTVVIIVIIVIIVTIVIIVIFIIIVTIVPIVIIVIIVTFVTNMINIITSWVLASARGTTTLGEVAGRSWTTSPWDSENR